MLGPDAVPCSPEMALLLWAGQSRRDLDACSRLRGLLHREIDGEYLISLAERHGMAPVLYTALAACGLEAVPHRVGERLRDQLHAHAASNLSLTNELLRLLALLNRHAIPAIPFKGPALAAALYGSLTLRPFADLDLLVHPRDLSRASELILSQGYLPRTPRTAAQEARHRRSSYCTKFVRPTGLVVLELHWSFRPSDLPLRLHPDLLWERLESIPLAGTRVASLRPELLLLLLCAHGSGHRWQALKWLCDVKELLRVYPGLDWPWLLHQSRELGCERMLLLGLRLAQDLLGAALPPALLPRLAAHPVVEDLVASVRQQLFQEKVPEPALRRMNERAFLFHLRERRGDRALYTLQLARAALTPGEEERALLRLPALLIPLYYLIRPFRLLGKYGLLLLQRSR